MKNLIIKGDLATQKAKKIWHGIITRVNLQVFNSRNYAYRDCTVCEEWKDFNNFLDWFVDNYIDGYQIDKDLLCKGNKCYCPECCCFIPRFINSILTKADKIRGPYPVGVDFHSSKYRARIKRVVDGKRTRTCLGYFDTPQDAFNAYKIARERYIKDVADRYYNDNLITENVYKALYEYEVEIDD